MSSNDPQLPLLAVGLQLGYNDGANKGFWRVQPRQKLGKEKGQWIEMGAELRAYFKNLKGLIDSVSGIAVGSDGTPNGIRVLIQGQQDKGFEDGIYGFDTNNVRVAEGLLSEEYLRSQGIEPGIPSDVDPTKLVKISDIPRADITPDDIRLANEGKESPEGKENEQFKNTPEGQEIARLESEAEQVSEEELKGIVEPEAAPKPAAKKPAAKGKTANDLTPDELAALKEKNAVPQDVSTLRSRAETIDNIVNDAYDKDEKTINKTLKKLHGFLGKSGTDPIGTPAVIERLSNIVEAIGGTPYTPEKSKAKIEDNGGAPRRGEQKLEDYDLGEEVYVYDDFDFSDETTKDVGRVAGITRKADGTPVLQVRFPNSRDPEQVWEIEQKDLSPIPDAEYEDLKKFDFDIAAKTLFERGMAGDSEKDLWESIADAPIDLGDDFNEDELELVEEDTTEDSTDGLDDIGPVVSDTPEENVVTKQPEEKEEPKYDRSALISDADLDAMGDPEEYRDDFGGKFAPSKEQTRVLNAIVKGKLRTVVDALAGSGKTTTLIGAANAIGRLRPNDRVMILTFNKKNAEDAKRKSPKANTDARTTHSLAYAALTKNQKNSMKTKGAGIAASDRDIATLLELDDTNFAGQNFSPADTAFFISKAITKFCNSADDEITEEHFKDALYEMSQGEDGFDVAGVDIPTKFLDAAKKYWENITSDEKPGYWDAKTRKLVGKKRIRVTQDHSLKMWSLSKPDLSKLEVNGKPVSVVFFDEAQDTNPAVAKVIADNMDKVQIAYVGDPNQAIYGFRGAENALEDAKVTAEAIVDLTVTRRFGEGLTAAGNAFLNFIGAARRVRGVGSGGEVVDAESMPDGPEKAHLVRTNVGGLDAIMAYMGQDKTVGVLSVFHSELEKAIYHLKWLSEDFSTRNKKGPHTPDGRPAFSEDFVGINNFKDLYEKAKKDPKSRAARWYNLVTIQAEGDIKKFEDLLEKLVIDKKDSAETDDTLDATPGNSGVMWISKSGDPINYEIDDQGVLALEGNGLFTKIDGVELKETAKSLGMRFSWAKKQWEIIISDDDERQAFLSAFADLIPNRTAKDDRIPDVVISTAHRAKGLEWDHVIIGDDFPEPKESLKTGEIEWPGDEELRLAYVALTRARKSLATGSLSWGMDYQGRDGLRRANDALGRIGDYGMGAWDYYDNQESEETVSSPAAINFDALDAEDYNSSSIDDEFGPILSAPDDNIPFVKDWIQLRPGEFSRYVSGVRWNIRQNRDGSIVVRPRTNEAEIGSTKYNSWEELEADFPNLVNRGNSVGKNKLKETLKPYDADGSLAKLIDSGATADEVSDALRKTQAWSDALDDDTTPFTSIAARLSQYDGQKDVVPGTKKRKTAKPPVIQKKIFTPAKNAEFYDQNPNRQDTGADVGRTPYSPEALAKIKSDGKAASIKRALLRAYPGAAITPDGRVVVYRKTSEEKDGPAAGQLRETEISVMEGKDSTLTLIVKVANPDTGESQEYYHYKNGYHSLQALIGDRNSESASIERLLSYYFDRDLGEFPYPGKTPAAQAKHARLYGGVDGSVAYLRRKSLADILEDPDGDDTPLKLRTPEEHAIAVLNGRNRRFNKSNQMWWTQMRKERASLFEALESGNYEMSTGILRSYINSIPDTPAAKSAAKDVIKRAIDTLYPNKDDARAKKAMLDRISDEIDSELPGTGSVVVPHLSRNGRLVKRGDYVEWTNNEGDRVVGQVTDLLGADNPNGGKYVYSDFAYVTFKGMDEKDPVLLNTKNMDVLDGSTELTEYKSWVREDDLKLGRYEEAGFSYDPETGYIYDQDGNIVDRIGDHEDDGQDDGDGGDDGEDGGDDSGDEPDTSEDEEDQTPEPETPTIEPKSIKNVAEGEKIYDDNDELVGTVKSKKAAKYKGTPGYVVEFEDGKKSFYPEDETVRSETDVTKQTTPGALVKRASKLGLGVKGGKSQKKLSTRKVTKSSDEGAAPIANSRGKVGVKPTDEAMAAKDEMLAIGAEAWKLAELEAVKNANANGIEGSSLDEILENLDNLSRGIGEKADATSQAKKSVNEIIDNLDNFDTDKAIADAKAAGYDFYTREGIAKFFRDNPEYDGLQSGYYSAARLFEIKKDESKASELKSRLSAYRSAKKDEESYREEIKAKSATVAKAQRDATISTLKKLGVKTNSVKLSDFEGHLVDDKGRRILDGSSSEVVASLKEAFQYIPRNLILSMIDHLKSTRGNLQINLRPVSRGDFSQRMGSMRIRVSKHPETGRGAASENGYTDTMLHELWHGMQRVIPNVRALEHAWSYGRVSRSDGSLPKTVNLYGRTKEKGFESDLAEQYMLKQYERETSGVFFNPEDSASEVSTVLMQDMFTSPGFASRGYTTRHSEGATVVAGSTPQTRQVHRKAYYDKATNSWFTDDTKSTKIDDVISVTGRSTGQGIDRDIKSLGMGLLLVLNDWSATEGVGPGNAVDTDGK